MTPKTAIVLCSLAEQDVKGKWKIAKLCPKGGHNCADLRIDGVRAGFTLGKFNQVELVGYGREPQLYAEMLADAGIESDLISDRFSGKSTLGNLEAIRKERLRGVIVSDEAHRLRTLFWIAELELKMHFIAAEELILRAASDEADFASQHQRILERYNDPSHRQRRQLERAGFRALCDGVYRVAAAAE